MSFKAESLSLLVLLELYNVLQIKIFHNLPTSRLEIHGSCSCRSHIPNSSHLGPRQGAQLDLTPFQVHGEVTSDCAADFLKKTRISLNSLACEMSEMVSKLFWDLQDDFE